MSFESRLKGLQFDLWLDPVDDYLWYLILRRKQKEKIKTSQYKVPSHFQGWDQLGRAEEGGIWTFKTSCKNWTVFIWHQQK